MQLKHRIGIGMAVLGVAAAFQGMCLKAFADESHYDVYSYDRWEEAVPSKAGYLAVRSVSGSDLGVGELSEPRDLFLDAQDRLWIADTGNNRLLIADSALTQARVLDTFTYEDGTVTELNQPEGIYVSPETGFVYIADYGNARVLICDGEGYVQGELTKPESELFSQELTFLPQKVIADKAGNVYIVLGNLTSGAVMFGSDGTFQGYYGANTVKTTATVISDYFWKRFATEEMLSHSTRTVPEGITNFDIDGDGFIYTCTQSTSVQTDTVKKLTPAGKNLFSDSGITWGDLTSVYDANTNKSYRTMLCDIEISEDGSINCLDSSTGHIFQYDEEGNLLFIFGSISDQSGGFSEASAIESTETGILVSDARKNTITVFEETDFGSLVHKAAARYNEGYYETEPWYEVLRYDGNYSRAYLGISAALFAEGDYEGAMKYAKLADSSYYYNRAFEGWRAEFLRAHIWEFVIGAFISGAILFFLYQYLKRKASGKRGRVT
jgi:hypothetical protein